MNNTKKVKCPVCGKPAEKRGTWKMIGGSFNRLYIHATKTVNGFPVVTESCIVRAGVVRS